MMGLPSSRAALVVPCHTEMLGDKKEQRELEHKWLSPLASHMFTHRIPKSRHMTP